MIALGAEPSKPFGPKGLTPLAKSVKHPANLQAIMDTSVANRYVMHRRRWPLAPRDELPIGRARRKDLHESVAILDGAPRTAAEIAAGIDHRNESSLQLPYDAISPPVVEDRVLAWPDMRGPIDDASPPVRHELE